MMVEQKVVFSLSCNQIAKVLIFRNEQPCVLNSLADPKADPEAKT